MWNWHGRTGVGEACDPNANTRSAAVAQAAPCSSRILGIFAAIGGAVTYLAFTLLTGMETSLIGIPVGAGVGQAMYYASGKRGGLRFQALAVFLAFVAFGTDPQISLSTFGKTTANWSRG